MLGLIIVFIIGLFIGWNFPQPEYAKRIQDMIVNKFKELFQKDDSNPPPPPY